MWRKNENEAKKKQNVQVWKNPIFTYVYPHLTDQKIFLIKKKIKKIEKFKKIKEIFWENLMLFLIYENQIHVQEKMDESIFHEHPNDSMNFPIICIMFEIVIKKVLCFKSMRIKKWKIVWKVRKNRKRNYKWIVNWIIICLFDELVFVWWNDEMRILRFRDMF